MAWEVRQSARRIGWAEGDAHRRAEKHRAGPGPPNGIAIAARLRVHSNYSVTEPRVFEGCFHHNKERRKALDTLRA